MATIITLSPNVASWSLGDPSITVSLSGGNAGNGSDYLWESNNGTFANKFASSTLFTPRNATKTTTISGKRVYHSSLGGSTGTTTYGINGGITKVALTSAWDSFAFLVPGVPVASAYPVFYEGSPLEITKEKAIGFLTNSTYSDPTIVDVNPNLTFTLCWHLLSNGTAIPRKQGTALSVPITYKAGDIFRVTLDVSSVTYTINGVVYATTSLPSSATLYPTMTFYSPSATFTDGSYLADPTNDGFTTLNVTGVVPIQANYAYDLTNDNVTIGSLGEDGGNYFRKRGRAKKTLALNFARKSFADYLLLSDFWKAHEKIERFLYKDLVANDVYMMRFESGLQVSIENPDVITIQATLKEI
jgi:hypothetical protein